MNQTKPSRKAPLKVLNRVLRYMLHYYALPFTLVIVCILITAVATVTGATFPQKLVDDYIVPMLNSGSTDFSGLAASLFQLAAILAVGVVTAFCYNRIMVSVSQGTMRRLRDDLFHRMESLPISYFDTHAHGDIMSVYTNDIDTLRQLLSQSIPQIINTSVTMLATLITMLVLNPALTVISILTACVMVTVTVNFSKLSGKYYVLQQRDLGIVDGFIEEMLDGQKVVKVFCHEDAALRDFRKVNDQLRDSADKANRYANLLMPINANIGWISYVLVAIVGAVLGINGLAGVILMGTVADHAKASLVFGKRLCRLMAVCRGWHYRSRLVDGLALGPFNKKFRPARTQADWVTSDHEMLERYASDPLCSFRFTVNAYYSMFQGMLSTQKKESVYMIPKTLPILFASGADDPVGDFGKGVRKIYEQYRSAGIQDVTLRLYTGDRHELLNETDRQQVYVDLYEWLEDHRSKA